MIRPVCLNAAAGLLTTLVNVLTSQSGSCSIMALMTFLVTGVTLVVFGTLSIIYKFFRLKKLIKQDELRSKHDLS